MPWQPSRPSLAKSGKLRVVSEKLIVGFGAHAASRVGNSTAAQLQTRHGGVWSAADAQPAFLVPSPDGDRPEQPGGVAGDNRAIRNIFRHHTPSAHGRSLANNHPAQ